MTNDDGFLRRADGSIYGRTRVEDTDEGRTGAPDDSEFTGTFSSEDPVAVLIEEHEAGEHNRSGLRDANCPMCKEAESIEPFLAEVEDMQDQVAQAAARLNSVVDELGRNPSTYIIGQRLRQAVANIEMAVSSDHEWLGASSFTLAATVDELRGIIEGNEEETR